MSATEGSGRTIDDAVASALKQLGLVRDDVDVEILQEPRPALLGLGGKEARVRVTRRQSASEECRNFTASVLEMMGYNAKVDAREVDEGIGVTLRGRRSWRADRPATAGRLIRSSSYVATSRGTPAIGPVGFQSSLDARGLSRQAPGEGAARNGRQAADRAVPRGHAGAPGSDGTRDRRTVHMALAGRSRGHDGQRRRGGATARCGHPGQEQRLQPSEARRVLLDKAPEASAGGRIARGQLARALRPLGLRFETLPCASSPVFRRTARLEDRLNLTATPTASR